MKCRKASGALLIVVALVACSCRGGQRDDVQRRDGIQRGGARVPSRCEQGEEVCFGEELFENYGCGACHGSDSRVYPLDGRVVIGEKRCMEDGECIVVDESYLMRSVLRHKDQTVRGYDGAVVVGVYRMEDADLSLLIAFLTRDK